MTNKAASHESIETYLMLKYGGPLELYTAYFNAHISASKGMKQSSPAKDIELIGTWMDYERTK